jgi:hypothetical protein
MKSLGVCIFLGSESKKLPDLGVDEDIPPGLDALGVEWQQPFNDTTAQHINNRLQPR